MTIKKLYGFSGNQCAFPDCTEELVTTNDTIVSEICHIEGLTPKSARYNPKLTAEQVNDFPNLIVLCLKHHTIVDKEEITYTVEALKKMKQEHEDKFRVNPYNISEQLVEKIHILFEGQLNIHIGSGNQLITQSGNINVGITSISEARELVQTLFKENFPKLRAIAAETALQNIKKFENAFAEKISSTLKPEAIKNLSDPDIQYVLTQSILQAGRRDKKNLREDLSYLIVERIKNHGDNLKSIVYNEAIETIGKLSTDGLKIICLCFILRYAIITEISSINQLNEVLKKLEPLLDFNNTDAEFQHIVYSGCGESGIGSWSYARVIQLSYPQLLPLTVSAIQMKTYGIPDIIIQELFTKENETDIQFKIHSEEQLETYLSTVNLDEVNKNHIRAQFKNSFAASSGKIEEVIQKFETITKISKIIDKSNLKHLTLTSVGIVIGAMYYEKITDERVSIDIWIH
ncbi:MAG: LPO_1073/Vpar_1526 family protein [Nitrosopumilaceae archaeon]